MLENSFHWKSNGTLNSTGKFVVKNGMRWEVLLFSSFFRNNGEITFYTDCFSTLLQCFVTKNMTLYSIENLKRTLLSTVKFQMMLNGWRSSHLMACSKCSDSWIACEHRRISNFRLSPPKLRLHSQASS